jgi:hypothetical protein
MTTSLAIQATVEHISDRIGRFFRFLPISGKVGDHYTNDINDFFERVLLKKDPSGPARGADRLMTIGRWWSYYFDRNQISPEVDRPKDIPAKLSNGRYVVVRTLSYSKVSINYNVVSNDMRLLEDLEEAILLRTIDLTQAFVVDIEGTNFSMNFQYEAEEGSISYRINPTEYGTVSVLSFPINLRYPVFNFPEEVKEIREIVFRIFLVNQNGDKTQYKRVEITP